MIHPSIVEPPYESLGTGIFFVISGFGYGVDKSGLKFVRYIEVLTGICYIGVQNYMDMKTSGLFNSFFISKRYREIDIPGFGVLQDLTRFLNIPFELWRSPV